MVSKFIERAKNGESIFISEIRDAFLSIDTVVGCYIETATGQKYSRFIPLPQTECPEEAEFVRDYFYANIYNMISAFGGKYMKLRVNKNNGFIVDLCESLNSVFQVDMSRAERHGYGKSLNVTDRVNASAGFPPFYFEIIFNEDIGNIGDDVFCPVVDEISDPVSLFKCAVDKACDTTLIGLDIGGTDIKAVVSVNGKIVAFKEYDWDPANMTKITQLTDAVKALVVELCAVLGEDNKPDAIGVGFPDVVLNNKIVGGETLKTRGIRLASPDYEAEFAQLLDFNDMLRGFCKPGGVVSMTNDGFLAAYTAAVEIAHSDHPEEVEDGIFAHTLGTELGTGWIDETGEIPQIPLEIYACVIDTGNFPAREYEPFDLRSCLNFNTNLPGTMQKYASQSGAYRLALEYFLKDAPHLYDELFDKKFVEEKNGGIYVSLLPEDMRKPFLAYIMKLADEGQPQAEQVFRETGKYMAATWKETEFLLRPKVNERILYGRFVKSTKCMSLMQEGAQEILDITMKAGDDDLAFTPLMKELKKNPDYTVAQFGQAIGSLYFAAKNL